MKNRIDHEVAPPSMSMLLWSAAGVLIVSLSAALALPTLQGVNRGSQPGGRPALASALPETARIDHSQVNWEAMTAEPDPSPMAVAAYGFGS